MSTTKAVPKGWNKVGQDGELALYASPDREQGVIFNEQSQETTGKPQPLQVFFKWGNFVVEPNAENLSIDSGAVT